MKTLLVIAVISGRLLGCDHAAPERDAGPHSGPPDAHIADAAAQEDANATDASNTRPDAANNDAAISDAAILRDASDAPQCPQPRRLPFPEICNGFDDDCDGLMDEGACNDPCDEAW